MPIGAETRRDDAPQFAELVDTSARVGATSARFGEVVAARGAVAELKPDQIKIAVAFLVGEPRQGRVGIGWATLSKLGASAASSPSLAVADVDVRDRMSPREDRVNGIAGKHPRGCESFEETSTETD